MGLFSFLKWADKAKQDNDMQGDADQEFFDQQGMTPEQRAQQDKDDEAAVRTNDEQCEANIQAAKERAKNQPY